MRGLARLALITLCACAAATMAASEDSPSPDLDPPRLIDAVASFLFPSLDRDGITHVNDDTVLLALATDSVVQLQRVPGQTCSFQGRKLNEDNPVVQQYNFARLTGEHHTLSNGLGLSSDIIFDGKGALCQNGGAGPRCQNAMRTTVGGLGDTRKALRAMSVIQQNFCAPAKPKPPR